MWFCGEPCSWLWQGCLVVRASHDEACAGACWGPAALVGSLGLRRASACVDG